VVSMAKIGFSQIKKGSYIFFGAMVTVHVAIFFCLFLLMLAR